MIRSDRESSSASELGYPLTTPPIFIGGGSLTTRFEVQASQESLLFPRLSGDTFESDEYVGSHERIRGPVSGGLYGLPELPGPVIAVLPILSLCSYPAISLLNPILFRIADALIVAPQSLTTHSGCQAISQRCPSKSWK